MYSEPAFTEMPVEEREMSSGWFPCKGVDVEKRFLNDVDGREARPFLRAPLYFERLEAANPVAGLN